MNQPDEVITLAVINDYPIIVRGVAAMFYDNPRIRVVEESSGPSLEHSTDLVLFDAFASEGGGLEKLAQFVQEPHGARVAVYSWHVEAQAIDNALKIGVDGYLSKSLDHDDLEDALLRLAAGEQVIEPRPAPEDMVLPDWPGQDAGLSPRESEVLALITQGATNEQIATGCYLSINSVKSYIRSAYRKIGVERRSQAVLWGVQNGMAPSSMYRG